MATWENVVGEKPAKPPGLKTRAWLLIAGLLLAMLMALLSSCAPRLPFSRVSATSQDSSLTISERVVAAEAPGGTASAIMPAHPDCEGAYSGIIWLPDPNARAELRMTRDSLNRLRIDCRAKDTTVYVRVRDTFSRVSRTRVDTLYVPVRGRASAECPDGVAPFWRVWALVATGLALLLCLLMIARR